FRSAARTGVAAAATTAVVKARVSFFMTVSSVDEYEGDDDGDQQAEPQQRPGRGALTGVQPGQAEARDGEDDAGDGEDVDEPEPDRAGVAALVQVVEVGDGAARGALMRRFTRGAVDGQPAVAARLGQGDIDFVSCGFG